MLFIEDILVKKRTMVVGLVLTLALTFLGVYAYTRGYGFARHQMYIEVKAKATSIPLMVVGAIGLIGSISSLFTLAAKNGLSNKVMYKWNAMVFVLVIIGIILFLVSINIDHTVIIYDDLIPSDQASTIEMSLNKWVSEDTLLKAINVYKDDDGNYASTIEKVAEALSGYATIK